MFICPLRLSTVATVLWKIQKSHFSTVLFIHTSYYFSVISEENKLLSPYLPHLKNVTTLPCKMQNFFIRLKVMLRSSKRWWLWKEPVVGWHWWLWKEPIVIRGNWNVGQSTSQQVFKVTTSCTDTCFQSFSPLINCIVHHALLKSSPCRNKMLPQVVRIADWYSIYDIRALAACPRCSNLPGWGQDWWTAVSYCAETRPCHEHDVLAHCLAGRQTRLQQCCRSP